MGLGAVGLIVKRGVGGGVLRSAAGFLRAVTGVLCPCCEGGITAATLYAKACPCYTFPDEVYSPIDDPGDCGLPEGACIYIDLRSVLSDAPTVTLADRIFATYPAAHDDPAVVVIVGGVCYRFMQPWVLYADPALTEEERIAAAVALGIDGLPWCNGDEPCYIDVPDSAVTAGGNGVELTLAVGVEGEYPPCSTEAGCSAYVNSGADFYKVASCDGSAMAQDLYVCARAAFEGNVVSIDGLGCFCIDRTEAFTAGEVAAAEAVAGVTLHTLTPEWRVAWAYSAAHPNREPVASCCFCPSGDCLVGQDWSNVWGADRWFYTEVCCGKAETLRFDVALAYTRTTVQTLGLGDVLTTTITAVVDSLEDRVGGGTIVHMTVTTHAVRPAMGIDTTSDSPLDLELPPVCCLPYSGNVPSLGSLTADGSTFIDDYDGSSQLWYQRTVSDDGPSQTPPIPDGTYRARLAWSASPWASGLPLNAAGDESDTYVDGLENSVGGSCSRSTFKTSGRFEGSGRTDEIDINLVVTVVADNGPPCNYIGECGSAGWGEVDLGEMMP